MNLVNARAVTPAPVNEPVLNYAPGSVERRTLREELGRLAGEKLEIPMVIGGQRVTGSLEEHHLPHARARVLARYHTGGPREVERAIAAAKAAWHDWSRTPFPARAAVFLRAAELLATRRRARINAATMLGQSKTAHQAEIDAACETIDFLRFNVHFAERLYAEQPISGPGMWNAVELRPLEGFVFCVTPFNFTAIGANLPTSVALMGNTVVWKPAHTAITSAWTILETLEEAGLPPGVINLVSGPGPAIGKAALDHPDLAGVHFTGSTGVFQWMWKTVGENIARYRSYPRLVGETGGKDFIVAHPSADVDALRVAIVRGGYEYQGQKCSAASRIYVAQSVWDRLREPLVETIRGLPMGDVADFTNFMGAVIDQASYRKLSAAIEMARGDAKCAILAGGEHDDREGWFIRPTLIKTEDARHELMSEELFGPVVTLHVYPDGEWDRTLELVDTTSPYALTGAVFATDRAAIARAHDVLRHAAGNFYVNDKPTGAVVGQQPFGGGRASGTNDKAGSSLNLLRWVSARTVKETLVPPRDHRYPYLDPDKP
jgi:1-pyrroline-5-carboxylate dehydrogenase